MSDSSGLASPISVANSDEFYKIMDMIVDESPRCSYLSSKLQDSECTELLSPTFTQNRKTIFELNSAFPYKILPVDWSINNKKLNVSQINNQF